MKKIIYNKLGLFILLSALGMACSEDKSVTESIVSTFQPVEFNLIGGTATINEYDGLQTQTFNFTLDESQITDVSIKISAGPSSTAIEGEDFDIITTSVDLLALQGQDGFTVDVVVYPDEDFTEGDEVIALNFTTSEPSGINTEVTVANLPKWPNNCSYTLSNGDLLGVDATYWESEAVLSGSTGAYKITGLGVGWMTDFWGEVIVTMNEVDITIESGDEYYDIITIPSQTYMETTYLGDPQDAYLIEGSGTISKCGEVMTIEYSLSNYGVDWGAWFSDNGYITEDTFTAYVQNP